MRTISRFYPVNICLLSEAKGIMYVPPVNFAGRASDKMNRSSKFKQGFTLVEVMVAMLLLSIFIGGALSLLGQTIRTHYLVRNRTEATNLAWSRVEQASNVSFVMIGDLEETGTRINRAGLPDDQGDFFRQTTITVLPGELEAVLIRVEVRPLNRKAGDFSSPPEIIETVLANISRVAQEGI
jgi:prepilin-type N-terminal cleavage/methylation domain-containing protein